MTISFGNYPRSLGFLWYLRPTYAWARLKDFFYYPKPRTYNVLKIKTLSPTWHDRDQVLLHACFQILVDFCEQELVAQAFEDSDSTSRLECWRLYHWWTKERVDDEREHKLWLREWYEAFEDACKEGENKSATVLERLDIKRGCLRSHEEEMIRKEKENLQSLINLRDFIWT